MALRRARLGRAARGRVRFQASVDDRRAVGQNTVVLSASRTKEPRRPARSGAHDGLVVPRRTLLIGGLLGFASLAATVLGCDAKGPTAQEQTSTQASPDAASITTALTPTTPTASTLPTAPSTAPQTVGTLRILVPYQGAVDAPKGLQRSKTEAHARAQEAAKRLAEGLPFEAAVARYSEDALTRATGGATGNFERNVMARDFSDIAFGLRAGETSKVVETPQGFLIVRRVR